MYVCVYVSSSLNANANELWRFSTGLIGCLVVPIYRNFGDNDRTPAHRIPLHLQPFNIDNHHSRNTAAATFAVLLPHKFANLANYLCR